jgi:hypothetical protein
LPWCGNVSADPAPPTVSWRWRRKCSRREDRRAPRSWCARSARS